MQDNGLKVLPVSSLVPYRVIKQFASVPAYFLSPVFILTVYVVDIAVIKRMNWTLCDYYSYS